MNFRCAMILLFAWLSGITGFAQDLRPNTVILGPDYQKGQTSTKKLELIPPQGWGFDKAGAVKAGLFAVLVPSGKNLENTDKAITIAFQKKAPQTPGLENLTNFFKADLQNTLARFPNLEAARWQPSEFAPDKIEFRSIEIRGKIKGQPSPHRLLMLDADDGFFSITLTTETVKELHQPEYEAFFNRIRIQ
ncbi:MAG: hypothetical protein K1Y36_18705 [Blastocatellia bacterium]|nr:hypothetical protein [Blastocatellia bacterium]